LNNQLASSGLVVDGLTVDAEGNIVVTTKMRYTFVGDYLTNEGFGPEATQEIGDQINRTIRTRNIVVEG